MQGLISVKTLTELAAIRSEGTLLVLLTGARTSTLFSRLPFLPAADAYVSENGGRLFFARNTLPVAVPISEDLGWRGKHDYTGKTIKHAMTTFAAGGMLVRMPSFTILCIKKHVMSSPSSANATSRCQLPERQSREMEAASCVLS